MSLTKNRATTMRRRRGISFVEVIATTIVVALLAAMLVSMLSIIRSTMRDTMVYTKMRAYAANQIEEIQNELENGVQIDSINYSDTGESSGIWCEVYIENVGSVFGVSMYRVDLEMQHLETTHKIQTRAVLREGCRAHVE